jgi:hypothetical protein
MHRIVLCVLCLAGSLAQPERPGQAGPQPEKPAQPEQPRAAGDEAAMMEQMNRPRPEHELLASMAGTFDVTITTRASYMPQMTFKGEAVREVILGGRFLQEKTEIKDELLGYTTMWIMGFNPDAESGPRFEVTRYSSMVTCTMPESGTWDEATRTITLKGQHEINGMRGSIRVLHTVNADAERAEVYLGFVGYSEQFKDTTIPEYHAMTIEYARRK